MMRHSNFSIQLSSTWKLAFIFAFLLAQLGWMPAGVGQVQASPALPAPLFAPVKPSIKVDILPTALIGEDVHFSVTFDNPGTLAGDTGYSPFVDVVIDATGADGNDGLGTIPASITASFLGAAISSSDLFVIPFVAGVAPADPPVMAVHPFLLDSTGQNVKVAAPAGFEIGDLLIVARLPFGSFAPDQPAARLDFQANLSNLADVGTPLNVTARGGYEFGFTPLDDWCCGDAAWPGAVTGWTGGSVTPALFTLSKTFSGPADETATGPNFLRQYTLSLDVAPGQTLTNLDLTDVLPSNLQFVSLDSTAVNGGAVAPNAVNTPAPSVPGGALTNRFASVSVNARMVFTFYVPRLDAVSASVINPGSGLDGLSCNNASITGGTWTPLDGRDTGLDFAITPYDPAGCEHMLTDKSLAIQKSVTDLSESMVKPGSLLEYRLTFQVSDFFALNALSITDLLSDGQHVSSAFTPTLQINGNGYTLATAAMGAANYDISCNYTGGPGPECTTNNPAADDGTTGLTFRISPEIIARGQSGRLLGGCVNPNGGLRANCTSATPGDGPTTGTITFRAVVQGNFTNNFPSGDASVDQGDILTNNALVNGANLEINSFNPQSVVDADAVATSLSLDRGGPLAKTVYAVVQSDGVTVVCGPGAVAPAPNLCPSSGVIKPGDRVTYRLTYELPTSNVEALAFTDYLPLPVFPVQDPDGNGSAGPAWIFEDVKSAVPPAPGVVRFGPADTFRSYSGIVPVVMADPVNNLFTIAYGNYDNPENLPTTVDLLFTVTASPDPVADNVHLTNAALAFEGSTNAGPAESYAIAAYSLNFLTDLSITKTDGSPTYAPGSPISYTIVVGNTGPLDATGASIADMVSAAITGVTAGCVASGTANCGTNATSGNSVSFLNASIPAGGANTLAITVNGTVSASATGSLVNTAAVTPATGQTDPNPANNTATDTDVDTTPPTVTISPAAGQADPTNTAPIPVTITFSEVVTGFALGDLTVGNGTAANFAGTGAVYTADITPTASGKVTVDVAAGVAIDTSGNGNTAARQFSIVYDATNPAVVITSPASNPTNIAPIPMTITFSEAVTGFVLGDIAVGNGTAGNFAGTGAVYTADITPAASGTVTVDVTAAVAVDAAGNGNTAAVQFSIVFDAASPTVTDTTPAQNISLTTGPLQIIVKFSKDVVHDGSVNAADNPANYLLVEDGPNGIFNTAACGPLGSFGLKPDDLQIPVDSVMYDVVNFVATLNINGGVPLPDGRYRLFVCGTTSIHDSAGNVLNGGADSIITFTVSVPVAAAPIPNTGFAPNRLTVLPPQSVAYTDFSTVSTPGLGDLWLEIPGLGVKMSIVGVPQTGGEWDVSWLGPNAGWLNGSAFPTHPGNSVITGHIYDAFGQPGPFAYLNSLRWGDKVIVHAWGGEYVYAVRSLTQVSPVNINEMMKHEERPWVTLVTCRGYDEATNSYKYRVLVRAVLVEVK